MVVFYTCPARLTFGPLCLRLYPACLLCGKGSRRLCTQNIHFGVTDRPTTKYGCRNGSLPFSACIHHHCKQLHWPGPLHRPLLVICHQKWPCGATLTQAAESEILRWCTCPYRGILTLESPTSPSSHCEIHLRFEGGSFRYPLRSLLGKFQAQAQFLKALAKLGRRIPEGPLRDLGKSHFVTRSVVVVSGTRNYFASETLPLPQT